MTIKTMLKFREVAAVIKMAEYKMLSDIRSFDRLEAEFWWARLDTQLYDLLEEEYNSIYQSMCEDINNSLRQKLNPISWP